MACGCTANRTKTMSRQVARKRSAGSTYNRNVVQTTSKKRVIIKRPAR